MVMCGFAKRCWDLIDVRITQGNYIDFSSWLCSVFQLGNETKSAEAGMLCWSLWKERNNVVWNQKSTTTEEIVYQQNRALVNGCRLSAQSRGHIPSHTSVQQGDGGEHWNKPPNSMIKVNVDAAIFDTEGKYGFSCVARDQEAKLLEALVRLKDGMMSPVIVEALGVKEALRWSKRNN